MKSRMDRYYDTSINEENTNEEIEVQRNSRTRKNDQLYKEVSNLKIENFDVNSNVSVIGKSSKNIDLQDVQEILDKRYHEKPKKKSIGDSEMRDIPKINLDETREYDINTIMEKARSTKEVNYEEERLKKLRNTQYDILKNLDLGEKKEESKKVVVEDKPTEKKKSKKTDKELLSLIDTITTTELLNEKNLKEAGIDPKILDNDSKKEGKDTILDNTFVESNTEDMDPLDLFSDLKGDDENTRVIGLGDLRKTDASIVMDRELIKDLEDTKINKTEVDLKKKMDIDASLDAEEALAKENITRAEKILAEEDEKARNTTATLTTLSNTGSFDDFADLREDMKFTRALVKILVVIIVIVFIAACVYCANKFLGLGWF